ncbi:hypothetical protein A4G19_02685 [Pasteurellaceae bacterium Macca]|nr:hypothetical protein [Pasteurellaceae bacterium Macca]
MEWHGVDLSGQNQARWNNKVQRYLRYWFVTIIIATALAFLLWQKAQGLAQRYQQQNAQQHQLQHQAQQIQQALTQLSPKESRLSHPISKPQLDHFLHFLNKLHVSGILLMVNIEEELIHLAGQTDSDTFARFENELKTYYPYQIDQFHTLETGEIEFSISLPLSFQNKEEKNEKSEEKSEGMK